MKKKKILMVVVVALLGSLLFAGGAGEFIGSLVGGGGVGAAIGTMILPGIGTAIGAALGLAVGGAAGATKIDADNEQAKKDASDAYIAALGEYNRLEDKQTQTKIDILQGQANVNSFDEALSRLPGAVDLERQQMQIQGAAQYSQLVNNWQGQELINASRGQTGGSAALVAAQQRAQLEVFAGKDLKFDLVGGMYANMMNEFESDYQSQLRELTVNRNNAQAALDIHNDNLLKVQEDLKKAEGTVATTKQNAINKGASI